MQPRPRSAPPLPVSLPAPFWEANGGRPLVIFLNPRAGPSIDTAGRIAIELREAFARHHLAVEVRSPPLPDLASAVRAEAARSPRAIIVGGGDGTLNAAAGPLVGTGVALGILPLGTLNHFAKDAGVPATWPEAVAAIARFETRDVDVADVNGHVVLNNCSIGGYSEALRRREVLRRRAGHGKWRAMLLGALAVLRRVPRLHVTLQAPDWSARLRASFVLVANNRYQDDVLLSGRRGRLDQGRLWIYASRVHRWRDLARTALQAWHGGIHAATQLESWQAGQLILDVRESPLPVAVDGEVVKLDPPLHFHIRPRQLRLIAPPARPPPA